MNEHQCRVRVPAELRVQVMQLSGADTSCLARVQMAVQGKKLPAADFQPHVHAGVAQVGGHARRVVMIAGHGEHRTPECGETIIEPRIARGGLVVDQVAAEHERRGVRDRMADIVEHELEGALHVPAVQPGVGLAEQVKVGEVDESERGRHAWLTRCWHGGMLP